MDFDHVIRVHADGTITEVPELYAPEMCDGELTTAEWTLLSGYTGQCSYNGPSMHASEYIGGRLARDILAEPGIYVALVDGSSEDDDPDGWGIAKYNAE